MAGRQSRELIAFRLMVYSEAELSNWLYYQALIVQTLESVNPTSASDLKMRVV